MKVLVTGGSGRLGSTVADDLIAHGYSVVNADIRWPAAKPNAAAGSYRFQETDLTDVGQVADAMHGCDAVIHLGAIPWPYEHADDVVFTRNTGASYAVLQAANLLGVRKAVIASTMALYGIAFGPNPRAPRYCPVDEDHELIPADPYALGKLVDEQIGAMFHRLCGMNVVALRFHWIAGEEDIRHAADATAAMPSRGQRVLWGFVDVRDAATACRLGLEAEIDGFESFLITGSDTLASLPTMELLARFAPDIEVRTPIDGFGSAFTIEKARRLLGFEPVHTWRR